MRNPFRRLGPRQRGDRARDARSWLEAATLYREHLAAQPGDRAIWIQLGHMLTEAGGYDDADAAYAEAERLRGGDADLLLCWGHSRKRAGDRDRARDLYSRSHAIDAGAHAAAELAAWPAERADEERAAGEEERAADRAEEPPAPAPDPPAWAARADVVKPFAPGSAREIALFVTHSATGAIKPHVLPYVRALTEQGIAVLLVAQADRALNLRPELIEAVAGAWVRENGGYDFAAWAHALRLHPEAYGADILYLINDSLFGPSQAGPFGRLLERVRASDADIVGLTESHEYRWHLQSYFLALKPRALSSLRLQRFFEDVRILGDKDRVIRAYEVRFSGEMEDAGLRTEVLFPSPIPLNPTLHGWRGLIADGFPFMKLLPLRGGFDDVDVTGWRAELATAGFDVALIDATVRASEQHVPGEHDGRLSAHPIRHGGRGDAPLKIAFYGPWNYDNGLGVASRAIMGALRHAGVRLNLHPIKKPFHIHRPLAPPVDVVEFHGPADVAIVHLNPDSWFLLTDEQRDAIRAAGKRIGYWVWEMGHIPPAWRHDFSSVDRIWAPSRYCAELFAAEEEAPVDVIPHPVPVLPAPAIDRATALQRLGLPAAARLILYVFDGSSYLVRKNPAALIRAFAASGLAEQGWTLLLKTKHLMDRPDEGAQLRALAEATDGVRLIDRTLSAEALGELWALADIYASPHCSEGFGLTIAEAMAAGKRVVATDFGGSVDWLDGSTGFPVKARPWTLSEDFGHYTRGGTWARVDEPALADALRRAAESDAAIGAAARVRVADALSYAHVGGLIDASLRALTTGRGGAPRIDRLALRLERGTRFEEADLGDGMVVVTLSADGAVTELPPDLPTGRDAWIAFAPAGSVAAPDFSEVVRRAAEVRPDVAIFYADDVAAQSERPIDQLALKPTFDRALLAATDYVGAPVIVRGSALAAIGSPRRELGTAALADMLFRADAAGVSIERIPRVLLAHPGARVRATPADYRTMLENQPALLPCDIVPGRAAGTFALLRRFAHDAPSVTLVVPTRNTALPGGGTYLERLLASVAEIDWLMDRLTVLVGDDVTAAPAWLERSWPFALRRIETPRGESEPFNYAAKMNRLWRAAETEQIVFVNDDVRPLDGGWLRALLTFAVDADVGGVGARLLFEDGSLQHAGMAPHGEQVAHPWLFRRRAEGTYQDWALTQREWSMVTGAVFATRRSLLEQVGGFDERFSLEFNDNDLCLRLRALGYRIVYTPLAELVHTEKASRGERLPPGDDLALFRAKWRPWLADDPAWHPRLRRDRLELTPEPEHGAWYL